MMKQATRPNAGSSPYEESLLKLSHEIGLNRVIAGFHFRSDIDAGESAGDRTHEFLTNMPNPYSQANPPPSSNVQLRHCGRRRPGGMELICEPGPQTDL